MVIANKLGKERKLMPKLGINYDEDDPKKIEEVEEMLSILDDHFPDMTKWEQDFTESIVSRWDNYKALSDRQKEVLTDIYEKYHHRRRKT